MQTLRPLRSALALLACLLTVLALPAGTAVAAKTTRSHKSSCTAASKSARHLKRSATTRCAKSNHKKSSHKRAAKKHAAKKGSNTVFLTPATCEDGSRPTRGSDGSFSCEDGSEPVCENGSSPVLLSSTAETPMCRVRPGHEQPGASGSECEGEECVSVEWICEDESGKAVNCEQLGESANGEEAEEPEE